jgi:hypothetical protein
MAIKNNICSCGREKKKYRMTIKKVLSAEKTRVHEYEYSRCHVCENRKRKRKEFEAILNQTRSV